MLFVGVLGGIGLDCFAEGRDDQRLSRTPTNYMLVITGSELLRGDYADAHTLFITRTLGPLGCRCVGVMCVGDVHKDLSDALAYAGSRANLIIVTGGLGPTDHDITREVLSEYTGIPLRENADVVNAVMLRYGLRTKDELRENQRKQTLIPEKGMYLPNPYGTAAGLVFEHGDQVVVALPGPPGELQPMLTDRLVPYLSKRFGIHSIGCSLTMRFVGIGESRIDQTLHEHLVLPEDLMISSFFELGRVDLTFSLPGSSPSDLGRLKALENDLTKYIGEYMYSDSGSSLEECVVQILAEQNASLAIAEVGSGGAIAASLNHAEGASRVCSGGYVAPSDLAMANMLGISMEMSSISADAVVPLMQSIAERICQKTDSEWGLAVSQVVEPENESRFVWVSSGTRQKGFQVQRMSLRGHGETAQNHLVNGCLDLLRRQLKKVKM
jgi:nicotinamide-nucleotide amidase